MAVEISAIKGIIPTVDIVSFRTKTVMIWDEKNMQMATSIKDIEIDAEKYPDLAEVVTKLETLIQNYPELLEEV